MSRSAERLRAARITHLAEADYVALLEPLVEAFVAEQQPRAALTVCWYLGDRGKRYASSLLPAVPLIDRARSLAAAGELGPAAEELEQGGILALAAVFRERAGDWPRAQTLWERVATIASMSSYVQGLVFVNLTRAAVRAGALSQARQATTAAVRRLEEAADHFESIGQRERAFDCFHALVDLGTERKRFEDILAGYINGIRILREDHLKSFALQQLDYAIHAAKDSLELAAAATLAKEASEVARSFGLVATGAWYTVLQADLWQALARRHVERGAPVELAENALLAAIAALEELAQFARVQGLFGELAVLDLEERKRAHYARAARRYAGVADSPLEAAPLAGHLRQPRASLNIWHQDILEWEQHGSVVEACADVLLNPRMPELLRRKAMLARLSALLLEQRGPPELWSGVVTELGEVPVYGMLSPLESLFKHQNRVVKMEVLRVMRGMFFKRTFVTLRKALLLKDPELVEQASKAIEALYFPHAFEPLTRIVREATSAPPRVAALKALARMDTPEACNFLRSQLEHGPSSERQTVGWQPRRNET